MKSNPDLSFTLTAVSR